MNGSTPHNPLGNPPTLATMGTHPVVGTSGSPSPRPSPPRRGGILDCESANPTRTDSPIPGHLSPSPSPRSRAVAAGRGEGWGEGKRGHLRVDG